MHMHMGQFTYMFGRAHLSPLLELAASLWARPQAVLLCRRVLLGVPNRLHLVFDWCLQLCKRFLLSASSLTVRAGFSLFILLCFCFRSCVRSAGFADFLPYLPVGHVSGGCVAVVFLLFPAVAVFVVLLLLLLLAVFPAFAVFAAVMLCCVRFLCVVCCTWASGACTCSLCDAKELFCLCSMSRMCRYTARQPHACCLA